MWIGIDGTAPTRTVATCKTAFGRSNISFALRWTRRRAAGFRSSVCAQDKDMTWSGPSPARNGVPTSRLAL